MNRADALRVPSGMLAALPSTGLVATAIALVVAAIAVAQVSTAGFVVLAVAALLTLAVATMRWPRAMLLVVVLTPIIDRFLISPLVPPQLGIWTRFSSEALLAGLTLVVVVRAYRDGTLVAALRQPTTGAFAAFLALALLSALVNSVPPVVAGAGLLFTLDAAVLFYLPRLVGFTHRQVAIAIGVLVGVVLVAAAIGLGQVVLSPDILWLTGFPGRSGEIVRVGSIVHDPNIMGTLTGMTMPFAIFVAVRGVTPRWRVAAAAVAYVMATTLLLTFSRGSWLGIVVGFGALALWIDRRVLLAAIVIGALALASAYVMPRGLLVPPAPAGPAPAPFNPLGTTTQRIGAVSQGKDLRTLFVVNAIPIVRDHPLIGVGPGRYGGSVAWLFGTPIYSEYGTDKIFPTWYSQKTVDNFWLHLLVESGIAGTIAFGAAILLTLVPLVRKVRGATGGRYVVMAGIAAAVLMLCVSTVTTMLLEGNTIAFVFWFLLGLGSLYVRGAAGDPSVRTDVVA